MRLLILADDDAVERQITEEPADLLISCGDIADELILRSASRIKAASILAVKGNHDSSGSFEPPIIDLHLRQLEIAGIVFGGFAGAWRYKPRGNYLFEQDEVAALMDHFPEVDVFVAHNSPRHIHDRDDDVHLGFDAFVGYIERAKPRLLIHGHQHVNDETQIGQTTVMGVYGFKRLELDVRSKHSRE